jgi:hypothetical protein
MNASLSSNINLKMFRKIMNSMSSDNTPGELRARYLLYILGRVTNVLTFSIFLFEERFRGTPAGMTGVSCTLN